VVEKLHYFCDGVKVDFFFGLALDHSLFLSKVPVVRLGPPVIDLLDKFFGGPFVIKG
jgi:hypothetical protein